MIELRLPRGIWHYDPESPLGEPGGFGAVFVGTDSSNAAVAVKRLHVGAVEAAHREMSVAVHLVGKEHRHVLPVLDAGLDANSDAYFVVMPKAERSLEDEISMREGPLEADDAVAVLLEIADGLTEIPELTHRDLKPANVLRLDGAWMIADFGIARFVEDATSRNTLKEFLSPQYAAPEQWNSERATAATDIYALGCIAFFLLTGRPPFSGGLDDLRDRHLTAEPPVLSDRTPALRSLVAMMLRKAPLARPTISRVVDLLRRVLTANEGEGQPGVRALSMAGAALAEAELANEAARVSDEQRLAKRRTLEAEGKRILSAIAGRLCNEVQQAAPAAEVRKTGEIIWLGQASLRIEPFIKLVNSGAFSASKRDVVTGALISVIQLNPKFVKSGTLLFTGQEESGYRWMEFSFESHPMGGGRRQFEPFGLGESELHHARLAMGSGMHVIQLAARPQMIDDEDEASFIDRWAGILAQASQGKLR